jgi:hypothetical protein
MPEPVSSAFTSCSGWIFCGAERVSEAVHVRYQRDNRARWLITADLCWCVSSEGCSSAQSVL